MFAERTLAVPVINLPSSEFVMDFIGSLARDSYLRIYIYRIYYIRMNDLKVRITIVGDNRIDIGFIIREGLKIPKLYILAQFCV